MQANRKDEKMNDVKYMTLSERGAATMFENWFNAMNYIDYILTKTNEDTMVLFELVDSKIVNGMRYYSDGRLETVL